MGECVQSKLELRARIDNLHLNHVHVNPSLPESRQMNNCYNYPVYTNCSALTLSWLGNKSIVGHEMLIRMKKR